MPDACNAVHPRICVIGAGPSGLTTLKNLHQSGLMNLVCYEASDTIGGNWAYSEEEGHSSVYASTFLISSKKRFVRRICGRRQAPAVCQVHGTARFP